MRTGRTMAAIYARVSTFDQNCENQLLELRRYCQARGWHVENEFVDHGVSGTKERRPALDQLVSSARRRQIDVVVCCRLDRLGRNLRHLVLLLEELRELSVGFVSLGEGIDLATPSGRLQLHVLAALAEFERGRIQERVCAGLTRARAQGKRLGRPRRVGPSGDVPAGLAVRAAAEVWGVSKSTAARRLSSGLAPMGQSLPKSV